MSADLLQVAPSRTAAPSWDHLVPPLFALLSALYFVQAALLAAQQPFWMDEILTLWTARMEGPDAIWSALTRGSEFTPPLNNLLAHTLYSAGITSSLGLRLPSIIAGYLVALASGLIVFRRFGAPPAAIAAGVILSSGLFGYALQLRPYALVTAAFACAVAVYDAAGRASARRLAALFILLVLAIGLHFYALILVLGLAGLELARARLEHRRPSWPTLAVIAAAAGSILLWWPILAAARTYSGADTGAPQYYGQPNLSALAYTYSMLLGWQGVPLIAILWAAMPLMRRADTLKTTAYVIALLPVAVFGFALVVSHSYSERYSLTAIIGIALLVGSLIHELSERRPYAAVLMLALLCLSAAWRSAGEIGKADRLAVFAAFERAPAALPVVTGSAQRFFEIRENVAAGDRLIFLDAPSVSAKDPTNRHQLLRWNAIDPVLRIADARAFLCTHPTFSLIVEPKDGVDPFAAWLAHRAEVGLYPAEGASLVTVRSRPCVSTKVR